MDSQCEMPKKELSRSSANILTESEIRTLINRVWDSNMELVDYHITDYSNEKLGFLASHHCLRLTVKNNANEINSQSFFLKNQPSHDALLFDITAKMEVFNQEMSFYNHILPLMKEGFQGDGWGPICYMITRDSLIFEDLRLKQFALRERLLNKEELTSALSTVARFHAASILAEKKLGRPLIDVCPEASDLRNYFVADGLKQKWIQSGVDLVINIANKLGLSVDKLKIACDRLTEGVVPSKQKQNVLTHSDLWSNNIMFDNNSPPNCLLVDYQMIRYSPLAHDVMLMLYLCGDRKLRKQHEKQLVIHYYKTLCETLRSNQSNIKVPPWLEVARGVEEQRLCGAIFASLYYPTSLLDGKACAGMFNDSANFIEFIFNDRTDNVFKLMQQNRNYAERINEAVTELVELSEKLEELPRPC